MRRGRRRKPKRFIPKQVRARKRRRRLLLSILLPVIFIPICYIYFLGAYGDPLDNTPQPIQDLISESQAPALENLISASEIEPEILIEDESIRFIMGNTTISDDTAISPQEKAVYYLKEHSDLFQLGEAGQNLRFLKRSADPLGNNYFHYTQQHRGVPVFGSSVIVQVADREVIRAVNASYIPNLEVEIQPEIRSIDANTIVLDSFPLPDGRNVSGTELAIYAPELWDRSSLVQSPTLAWFVTVQVGGAIDRYLFTVDAKSGEILQRFDLIKGAQGTLKREIWDAQGANIEALLTRAQKVMDISGTLNGKTPDEDAFAAWQIAEDVNTYFWNQFQRESFDDAGGAIKIFVNVQLAENCPGIWIDSLKSIAICENWGASRDLINHEFAHGVIASTANFFPTGESLALEEALADVFAAFNDPVDPWRITQDPGGEGPALRDIAEVPVKYPMHLSEWVQVTEDADEICPHPNDQLPYCPYTNSHIFSHAVYLMVEGGSENRINVEGIGMEKAQIILYNTLAHGLGETSGFQQAAWMTLAVCKSFIGQYEIEEADCLQAQNAFAATGLIGGVEGQTRKGEAEKEEKSDPEVDPALTWLQNLWYRIQRRINFDGFLEHLDNLIGPVIDNWRKGLRRVF